MSEEANIDTEEIKVEKINNWALALMKKGLIVKLSISRWRAQTRLTFNDLGLRFADVETAEFMRRYINLGTQKLLPPEVLNEIDIIERRARRILEEYSFNTGWGRFVPETALDEWGKENKAVYDDFVEAAKMLGVRYDEIIAAVKSEYKNMAKDVWRRLYSEDSAPTESFIEDFVSKIISKIPSKEDLIDSFRYRTTFSIILTPSSIEKDVSEAKKIKRESEMKDFEAQLERDAKERLTENYIAKTRDLIDDFLDSTIVNMREYIKEFCDAVLESIGRRKSVDSVVMKDIKKLKKMIKKVHLLNFYGDKEITDQLSELEREIDKFKGERSDELIIDKLKELVKIGEKEFNPQSFNPAISYLEF